MIYKDYRLNANEVKSHLIPRDFYTSEQGLLHNYKGKWAESGLCPFHEDNAPGSFFINLENGAFKCFSCGAKGGDIISFVMQKYDLSFREALELLDNGGLR